MTFYKTLKEAEVNGKTITAYEYTEKFSTRPQYQIVKSENGIGYEVISTAKTTWKKKFEDTVEEEMR